MSRAERAANQAGAFAVNPRRAAAPSGRAVLLVDDVLTTGRDALGLRRLPAGGGRGAGGRAGAGPRCLRGFARPIVADLGSP